MKTTYFPYALVASFIFFLTFPTPSKAGFRRGNGGFVYICPANSQPSYQLSDLWEAVNRYHYPLQLQTQGDEYQRAQAIIDRLRILNPTRYHLYTQWLQDFPSETLFLDDMNLAPIPDRGVTPTPVGCTAQQLVVQVEPIQSDEKRYTIDRTLWNHLDLNNRAAAILHELIYREAISPENQHEDSEFTRRLNAFIHSELLSKTTLKQWLLLNQNLGFHQADAHGIPIRLNSFVDSTYTRKQKSELSFEDDNHLMQGQMPIHFAFTVNGTPQTLNCPAFQMNQGPTNQVTFIKGHLLDIQFFNFSPECYYSLELASGSYSLYLQASDLEFSTDGSLSHLIYDGSFLLGTTIYVVTPHKQILISYPNLSVPSYELTFENGLPKRFWWKKDLVNSTENTFVLDTDGQWKAAPFEPLTEFN